ncbi:PREDICTED: uncharacterized protein LOC105313259 [Amphimedon queenslandica]|uniref:AIG1-type G domain-containing protein n=1 Tax=Amphimedon queenslandica TaxID=400682 RepID=A0A1X7UJS2_AMPQE|nr:PREDICTED: uncharacterized protein LOC105313259 [Amphimedon queenslandica]|eukprot:XP_011404854.1 PREDICTED: uncharacterized protein LOC105313259 [Amphimedon queenslandica]
MSVLLIGSTGMGKSSFGNFLIDPGEKHVFDNPTFSPGTDGRPKTQEVKSKNVQLKSGETEMRLDVIDTPGLNESAEKDLSHMIDIIKKLNDCEGVKACILVVKFNAKIDAQYKATIEYYSKLLPGLFERNVIIVLTEYATDERSEQQRKKKRIDVEQIKHDTIAELKKCSNQQIMYSPQLFMIDCLPVDDDELKTSLAIRSAILHYIFQLPPIKVKNVMVAKTDYIKQKDAEKYKELQGEIAGYSERLKEVNALSKNALDETRHKTREINEIESKICNLKKQLEDKDKEDKVVAEHQYINKESKELESITEAVDIKSPYEITSYMTWTNGRCEFKVLDQTPYTIKGTIEGEFMRGIYASVTAYTEKRIKYTGEIEELKKKIKTKNENLIECKKAWEKCRVEQKEYLEEIKLLEKYIAQRHVAAQKCRSDIMTIEEAAIKLEELQEERFDD